MNKSITIINGWEAIRKEMYFDSAYYESHVDRRSDEYRGISNKWFTNKDLENISYRTINYWDEKGYLTGEKNVSGWRKFDFVQLLWIQVLESFRKLGVSLDVVVPAIFTAFGYIPDNGEKEKQELLEGLKGEQQKKVKELIGNYINFQSTFRFYVLCALSAKVSISIRYYPDGRCKVIKGITSTSTPEEIQQYLKESTLTHVSISINELIKEFIISKDIETIDSVSIVSENELELIRHLRNKDVSEVNVFLDKGEPVRLDIKDAIIDNEELNKRVYEYLGSPYQKIEFKTSGGKTATFERTTTIKLKRRK